LGPGFREEVYENALCLELEQRSIRYERQVEFPVHYLGRLVGDHQLDLVIQRTLVVELKAVFKLAEVHQAQLLAYLRAADLRVGLLLNFGEVPLGIKRIVNRYQG
jgi:GxxExxY protein